MRKLAIVMAFASTALATTAQARDGAWYVGVEGGGMIVEDSDFDLGATSNAVTVEHEKGFDVDGIIGYDFGGFRAEFEVGYKDANLDSVSTSVAGVPGGGGTSYLPGGAQPAGTYEAADGNTRVLSFMLNALLDFGNDDGWNGYIGGGAGVARVKESEYQLAKYGSAFVDDSDRSEEHTSELQSLMRISYAVFCLKKKKQNTYIIGPVSSRYTKCANKR